MTARVRVDDHAGRRGRDRNLQVLHRLQAAALFGRKLNRDRVFGAVDLHVGCDRSGGCRVDDVRDGARVDAELGGLRAVHRNVEFGLRVGDAGLRRLQAGNLLELRDRRVRRQVVERVDVRAVDLDGEGVLSARDDVLHDVDRAAERLEAGDRRTEPLVDRGDLFGRERVPGSPSRARSRSGERRLPLRDEFRRIGTADAGRERDGQIRLIRHVRAADGSGLADLRADVYDARVFFDARFDLFRHVVRHRNRGAGRHLEVESREA